MKYLAKTVVALFFKKGITFISNHSKMDRCEINVSVQPEKK